MNAISLNTLRPSPLFTWTVTYIAVAPPPLPHHHHHLLTWTVPPSLSPAKPRAGPAQVRGWQLAPPGREVEAARAAPQKTRGVRGGKERKHTHKKSGVKGRRHGQVVPVYATGCGGENASRGARVSLRCSPLHSRCLWLCCRWTTGRFPQSETEAAALQQAKKQQRSVVGVGGGCGGGGGGGGRGKGKDNPAVSACMVS